MVDTLTWTFFVAWYQLSNTLDIEASRLWFQPTLYAGLQLIVPNVVLRPFHTRKEMKITGSQVRADDGGWSNTSHRKRFRSPFVAAALCGRTLSWWRTIPEDNISRRIFWIKKSNYSTQSIFGGRLLFYACLRAHYALRTDKCNVSRSTGIRDIAQHICAKLHLTLTVVLISRSIGPWKKIALVLLYWTVCPTIKTQIPLRSN